jgi:hypothetical protein
MGTHCIIHSRALASRGLSPILEIFLQRAIGVEKYIRTRSLKARIFTTFHEEMGM